MTWTRLKRISAPLPVLTVADVKQHLNIAHSDDDATLSILIDVATGAIDGGSGIGLALNTQVWRLTLDRLPACVTIPLHPVQSVQSVKVFPADWPQGITIDPESYRLDADQRPARLVFEQDVANWDERVQIEFTAGYGADVPADLLHVIRMLVGHYYNNREATSEANLREVPMAVATIMQRYSIGL